MALYIGGRDPLAQHFAPIASAPLVDVIGVGNGANGACAAMACKRAACFLTRSITGNITQASALPGHAACPPGSLQFLYGGGAGFATLSFALSPAELRSAMLTVTFYDESGVALYNFTKGATRSGVALAAPVEGKHGDRSGLMLVILLLGLGGAGAWHWKGIAEAPPEPEPPKPKAKKRGEGKPLLPTATGLRFNTFSL